MLDGEWSQWVHGIPLETVIVHIIEAETEWQEEFIFHAWGNILIFFFWCKWICNCHSHLATKLRTKLKLKMIDREMGRTWGLEGVVVVQLLCCVWLFTTLGLQHASFPVYHHLLELAQTHVHWVGDAIQPSHPLSSPSPAINLSKHQGLFQWVSSLHQVGKVLELQL